MNSRILAVSPLAVLLAMTAVPALVQAQAGGGHAAIEKQIIANERAINDAIAKGDMKTFHANIASDAVGIDPGGISKVNAPDFDKSRRLHPGKNEQEGSTKSTARPKPQPTR